MLYVWLCVCICGRGGAYIAQQSFRASKSKVAGNNRPNCEEDISFKCSI